MSLIYNDTANLQGIIQAEESYCQLGVAGISGNTNLLKEFCRNNNVSLSKIWTWIFFAYGGWQYDDSNQTNLPQAAQDLVSGTFKYALPTEALTIRGIEILDTGGIWNKLTPLTEEEIRDRKVSFGEFGKNSGFPRYYTVKGGTVILDAIPNFNSTKGFKVFFDRASVGFSYDATSVAPGFASEFHNAVAVGGSIEWLKVHKPDSTVLTMLVADWKQYEQDIKKFYVRRWKDMFPPKLKVVDYLREMN